MTRYYYDLHIHSCLSPCGDDDMTPNNIAGMAALKGLGIIALTDHNTTANCPAFFTACKRYGIIPVPGVEVTTSEDVHIVCLFPSLDKAMDFGIELYGHRILYENRPDIFGKQQVLDGDDNIIGEEKHLLINATDMSCEDTFNLAKAYGAAVFPAHIDRQENGIINMLGALPETPVFGCVEFHGKDNIERYTADYRLGNKLILTDSDAHYLENISEAENYLILDDDNYSSALVRERLIDYLNSYG